MGTLRDFVAYREQYRAKATQLREGWIALEWYRAGTDVDQAAAWANLGHMPGEAADLIAAGITPAMQAQAPDPR